MLDDSVLEIEPETAPAVASCGNALPRDHRVLERSEVDQTAQRIGTLQARLMVVASSETAVIERAVVQVRPGVIHSPVVQGGGSEADEAEVAEIWTQIQAAAKSQRSRDLTIAYGRLHRRARNVRWNPLITHAFHRSAGEAGSSRVRELSRRLFDQWREAVNHLVMNNWRFSTYKVNQKADMTMPIDDQMQAGVLGLMRAAEGYIPQRKKSFSTYAGHWIRGATTVARRKGIDYTAAAQTGVRFAGMTPMAIDEEENWDVLEHGETETPASLAEEADAAQQLRRYCEQLPERHRRVIERVYGLDGEDPVYRKHYARDHQLSAQAVDTLHDEALRWLRQSMTKGQDRGSG